jgi:hypothetical protein
MRGLNLNLRFTKPLRHVLAVAAPIVAWVEQAALLLLIMAGGLIALGFAGWWAKGRGDKCIGPVGGAPRASGGVRRRRRALVWRRLSGANGETTNTPALVARVLSA